MSLTTAAVAESLKRVLRYWTNMTDEQVASYVQGLVEDLGWMKPFEFDEVCKRVSQTMSKGQKPVPSDYKKVWWELSREKNWRPPNESKCEACGGFGFVGAYYLIERTAEEIYAMKACPKCRPNWVKKEGLIEMVSGHDDRQVTDAKRMSVGGARFVLDKLDKSRIRGTLPDKVAQILVDRSVAEALGDKPSSTGSPTLGDIAFS